MDDGEDPAPKPKRSRRAPMPEKLKARAKAAAVQHQKRYTAPVVKIMAGAPGKWDFESPYRSADEVEWWNLLGEAFGTRTYAVVSVFMDQLSRLVSSAWHEGDSAWLPDEGELRAAISIVASLKPSNEAEAAHAAQAVALHLASMKVGGGIARQGHVDPRQANALANLSKAYSGVMDTMRKRRGGNTTRQVIKVQKDVRIYNDNRSVTVGGGGRSAGDQPDEAGRDTRARPDGSEGRTCTIEGSATMLGPPEVRGTVQSACDEGPQGVPSPRRKVAGGAEG